jgi:methyl-accepting chemotaxis protein
MNGPSAPFRLRRSGLALKLVGPSALVTALVTLVMVVLASSQVDHNLTAAFASKGEAIAISLAATAEQSLSNASTLQGSVDSNKLIAGVRYIFVQDSEGALLAHTFSPSFPPGLERKNVLDPSAISSRRRVQVNPAVELAWPGGQLKAIDVAAPVAGGALGTIHVGMDRLEIEHEVRRLQRKMGFTGAAVALLGIAFGTLTAVLAVIRPVRELTRVTQEIIRQGDLTQQIRARSSDELGQLAESFATMVGKLREALNNLRTANDTLGKLMAELNRSAGEQTRNVNRQATALQETQVTAQEIKQTSLLAAEKAERVLKDAERADQISRVGEEAIERSVSGLTDIRAQVGEIAGRIQELSSRTAQIGGITETVKDLADQSNMLALNAAIEAVRSGEHGKGFAVVAREIRALADQSIEATRRVREVLENIGASIRGVVAMTQAGAQRIEAGLEQVRASGQNLAELSAIVRDNSASARQIAAAVSQQNAGISQIFSAVTDLSRMMGETMASLEATNATASQLESVSTSATEAVKTYRV